MIVAENADRGYSHIIELVYDSPMGIRIAEQIIKSGYKDSSNIYFSYYTKDTLGKWVQIYDLEEYE